MRSPLLAPRHMIEASAIGGPFCGSLIVGYGKELYAYAIEGGQRHRYLLESDEGAWAWRYDGVVVSTEAA